MTAIIQKVTGESYYTYIKKELLYPNGIEHMLPFNEVSDTQKMVLPNYERNKKNEIIKNAIIKQLQINEAILPHQPILFTNTVYEFIENVLINWYIKFNLETECSSVLGAGDMMSTLLSYWKFVNTIMLNNTVYYKLLLQQAKKTKNKYFGGVYFRENYICASGNIGKYNCSCFATNYKTKKILMFFTNNMNYSRLKKTQQKIYQIYFGQNFLVKKV